MHIWRSVYEQIREEQKEVYNVLAYPIIKEYQRKPIFPPPFSLFYYIFAVIYFLWVSFCKKNKVDIFSSINEKVKSYFELHGFGWTNKINFFGLTSLITNVKWNFFFIVKYVDEEESIKNNEIASCVFLNFMEEKEI